MKTRQERLTEVFAHVKRHFGIFTQQKFAEAIGYSRSVVSLALNGDEKSLTNEMLKSVCDKWPDVFDRNYIMTGEGSLLTLDEEVTAQRIEQGDIAAETIASVSQSKNPDGSPRPFIPTWADTFIDLFTQQVKANEHLNQQLQQSLKEVADLKDQLREILQTLKK